MITTATYAGARLRRALGHGPDEGRAARAATRCCCRPTSTSTGATRACFKAAVAEVAPRDRGPRHRRDLHRPHATCPARRTRSATTRFGGVRAVAQDIKNNVRARHRPDLLDRRHAEQAAVEDRLRARQARRPDDAHARRPAQARSGRCRCARINGIGPKAGAKLAALGITRIGELAARDARLAGRAVRPQLRRLAARRGARRATTGRWSRSASRCR